MKTVVLSDAHLEARPSGRERREQFAGFLRSLPGWGIQRLIVLGDVFDFWFEYRHAIFSEYFDVLRAFAELRDAGVDLHLVCGNHDFWAGHFLRDHLGFHIYQSSVLLDFDGRRAWLAHGDGLNPRDRGYRVYKRIARARVVVGLFGLLHPDWAMALAQRVSHTSRKYTRAPDLAQGPEAKALRAYARGVLERDEADVVLCGHAHAATLEEYPTPSGTGLYINTGDWMEHRSYVVWDGHEFTMVKSEPPQPVAEVTTGG